MVTIKKKRKKIMKQCMLGAMDEFCTMLVPSMHCNMIIIIIFFFLMVTIVEVHKLILDVCVSLIITIDENFLWPNCLESPLY